MNRTEIAPLVRNRLGLNASDQRVRNDLVYGAINSALRRMAKDFDWPWLVLSETFTLTAGDTTQEIPEDWLRTLWITVPASGTEIRNTQRRAMLKWAPVRGFIKYFSTEGRVITFAPTPTKNVVIEHQYVRDEVQLDDDTDEPLCPDNYIDILVLYAAMQIAVSLRDTTMLSLFKDEVTEWKKNAELTTAARPNLSIRVRNPWRLWV